jgi:hypothetical protein
MKANTAYSLCDLRNPNGILKNFFLFFSYSADILSVHQFENRKG